VSNANSYRSVLSDVNGCKVACRFCCGEGLRPDRVADAFLFACRLVTRALCVVLALGHKAFLRSTGVLSADCTLQLGCCAYAAVATRSSALAKTSALMSTSRVVYVNQTLKEHCDGAVGFG
jgi:hypothetical protein